MHSTQLTFFAADVFFKGGFLVSLAFVGLGLMAVAVLYFLIMSAIANHVNRPRSTRASDPVKKPPPENQQNPPRHA
jgi:hypothetical protein